jgi:hypothetical protein
LEMKQVMSRMVEPDIPTREGAGDPTRSNGAVSTRIGGSGR